ncbi:hypothetical protein A1O1_05007 [Capronia coronata CBS 617.96]|uniref:Uncharacterized protein n=1 Tax=Capronia coronata CBS 617.96 TaxID=1182541 RepID=W9Z0M6_9EURO|nr:uncharacterized protein A1O1_05007 [Capronia coronata CBS 617.96]EXJ88079.1 hypothetical protein A1O1_05007 [Capronia coronata CBS 617.96]
MISPLNILASSHDQFKDPAFLGSLATHRPVLKDAVLACSMIHLSNSHDGFQMEALRRYNRALAGLRMQIEDGSVTGEEDWILFTTILLHVFEVSEPIRKL